MKREYGVSYTCIFTTYVEAESPAEAADLAETECPCQVDSTAFVWRSRDDDPQIVVEWDEEYQILPNTDDGDE